MAWFVLCVAVNHKRTHCKGQHCMEGKGVLTDCDAKTAGKAHEQTVLKVVLSWLPHVPSQLQTYTAAALVKKKEN